MFRDPVRSGTFGSAGRPGSGTIIARMKPAESAEAADVSRLGRAECLQLLAGVQVGRLIFTINAMPAVRPLKFALAGDLIVVRTDSNSAAAQRAAGSIVAFEVDELQPATCSGWSVTATGRAALVTDPDAIAWYSSLRLVPWAPGPRDQFMTISAEVIEGQRVGPMPTPA